jgi:L-lactate utilization protein LutC
MMEIDILNNIIINKTIKSLEKHFFEVKFVNSKEEALLELEKIIDKKSIIGFGGSRTLEEIDFFQKFNIKDYPNLLDRNNQNLTPEKKNEVQKKAILSDYFISSVNAVSSTGELVLIDKWGNRCGPMTYGPEKKIFIVGRNKIVPTLENAIDRASNKAAVLNNIRFDTKNPCTKTGACQNCESENRICGVTTLIHRCFPAKSILIILVNEDLGF